MLSSHTFRAGGRKIGGVQGSQTVLRSLHFDHGIDLCYLLPPWSVSWINMLIHLPKQRFKQAEPVQTQKLQFVATAVDKFSMEELEW